MLFDLNLKTVYGPLKRQGYMTLEGTHKTKPGRDGENNEIPHGRV